MKYEYKTVCFATGDASRASSNEKIQYALNAETSNGWEYVDNIVNGSNGCNTVLIFRKRKS